MKFTKAILDKNYNEGCYDAQLSPNPMSPSIVSDTVPTVDSHLLSPNQQSSANRVLEIEIIGSPKPAQAKNQQLPSLKEMKVPEIVESDERKEEDSRTEMIELEPPEKSRNALT